MALTDLTRISTSGIATGTSLSGAILHGDAHFRGTQVGVTSALFDSSDNAFEFNDNVSIKFGTDGDGTIKHTGSNLQVQETTGNIQIVNYANDKDVDIKTDDGSGGTARYFLADGSTGETILYNYGNEKIKTTSTGAVVTGILTATGFSGPTNNTSGIATFYDLRVSNNLTVEGTTTTLDTNLIGVDRIEVGANSNSIVGVAVTQSGTADIVNLFDGATKVVTVDDTGKVGIGTDSPDTPLHILSSANNLLQIESTDRHSTMYLIDSIGSSFIQNDSGELRFGVGGGASAAGGETEVVRIDSDGKVGVGTNNPDMPLHLSCAVQNAVKWQSSDSDGPLTHYYNGSTHLGNLGNSKGVMSSTDLHFGIGSKSDLLFGTKPSGGSSTVERLRITSAGQVGIGTTNPDTPLHIYANDAQQITVERASNANSSIRFRNTVSSMFAGLTSNATGFAIDDDDDLSSGPMFFVERSTGNIGVNCTPTAAPLEVKQQSADGGVLRLRDSSATYRYLEFDVTGALTQITARSNNSHGKINIGTLSQHGRRTCLFIDNDGDVGIGTDNLVAGKFEVNTGTESNGATEYYGEDFAINIRADKGPNPNDEGNGICFTQQWYDSDAALVRAGAIVSYKVAGNGAFGGGLKFKVQQTGANPMRDIVRMRSTMVEIPHDNVPLQLGGAGELRMRHTGSEHQIYGTNTDPFVFSSSSGETLRITGGGVVQIGGVTANSADIDASNTKLTIKQSANNKEDGIYIERSGERRGHYIYVGGAFSQSDALCISTNQLGGDTDLLAIDRGGDVIIGTGNVGINETAPSEKLQIDGDILLGGQANASESNYAIKFEYNNHQFAKIVGDGRDQSGYGDIDFYTSTGSGASNLTQRMSIRADGKIGIGNFLTASPSNQLHITGTTGTNAGGLLRLDATTGDNFIILDNTHDSSEWVFGNDSTTRDQFRMYYNGGSGYGDPIIDVAAADGVVTIDGGTTTLVKIKGNSAGTAGLRLGGESGSGTDQCTGFVEVHQDENHGGGMFYNGDGSPSFASGEAADYFAIHRLSSGSRHVVQRWFHSSNDCEMFGNLTIDNGTSTLIRVRGDSNGTSGISCGGGNGQTQCTGFVEVTQDEIHGGGIFYNGDGSPSFANDESADRVTFYRMHNSAKYEVFSTPYSDSSIRFRGDLRPAVNNNIDLGSSSNRWRDVYCNQGAFNNSDEVLKQDIESLSEIEMRVAKKLSGLFKTYKWKDSVKNKGDKARIHTGMIAQQIVTAIESEGLDYANYGFIGYDEWYQNAKGETITLEDANDNKLDGYEKIGRYSVRYTELLSFIAAYNEQRFTDLESRVAALEG